MAQFRLRQALQSLIARRCSLSPSPLLKPLISSSFSLSSRQQRDTCSLLTSLVQSRACASYTTVSENNSCTSNPKVSGNNACASYQTVSESKSCTYYPTVSENKISRSEWFKQGVNHWQILMNFGDLKPSREEMISTYMETCAKALNISLEEAKQRIYAGDTTNFRGFRAKMSTEESEKFKGDSRVVIVYPDPKAEQNYEKYRGDLHDDITSPNFDQRLEQLQNEISDEISRKIKDDVYKSAIGNCQKGVHDMWADFRDKYLEDETDNLNDLWSDNETDDLNDFWPEEAADDTPPADEVSYGQGPN